MLDFILDYGIEFKLIEYLDSIEELNKLKKSDYSKSEFKKMTKIRSKNLLEMKTLEIALIFKDLNEIYFPVRLDFRGRVYPVVDFLNYQGTDLAKSLLVFSKGEKIYKPDIESIKYLLIYGANCYGNGLNRKSIEEKLS
jgi:DNA-directed RNA polymerase